MSYESMHGTKFVKGNRLKNLPYKNFLGTVWNQFLRVLLVKLRFVATYPD